MTALEAFDCYYKIVVDCYKKCLIKIMEFHAVIFAAGVGTRFRDIVGSRPKCLLTVGGFPL